MAASSVDSDISQRCHASEGLVTLTSSIVFNFISCLNHACCSTFCSIRAGGLVPGFMQCLHGSSRGFAFQYGDINVKPGAEVNAPFIDYEREKSL